MVFGEHEIEVVNIDNVNKVANIDNMVGENVEEEVEEPKVGMIFDNIDDLIGYYRGYGNQMGFRARKRSSKKDLDGVQRYVIVVCNRSGTSKHTSKNVLKPHLITKSNCDATMTMKLEMEEKWIVTNILLNQNHILSSGKSRFHRCNKVISKRVKRKLELNDRTVIQMSKSFQSLAVEVREYENLNFSEKDCRTYINKVRHLRLGEGDANVIQNYFLYVQAIDPKFFI